MEKLRKKGRPIDPVIIEGRAIATTFWGKAWCENLESYHDFETRLPRGRAYARNGSVVDLQIAPLTVTAMVSGSSIYEVKIDIAPAPEARWKAICRDCAGGIDSLVELLQGRFSKGVMERLCRQDQGLFPRPSEIEFSCNCLDYASLCKHVAAVLYGVGARLDHKPELLFRLRAVDENDLLVDLDAATPLSKAAPAAGRVLEADDLSALFGLEMAQDEGPAAPPKTARTVRNPTRTKKAETVQAAAIEVRPGAPARRGSKKPSVRPAASKPALELTPDGFVKWWK